MAAMATFEGLGLSELPSVSMGSSGADLGAVFLPRLEKTNAIAGSITTSSKVPANIVRPPACSKRERGTGTHNKRQLEAPSAATATQQMMQQWCIGSTAASRTTEIASHPEPWRSTSDP